MNSGVLIYQPIHALEALAVQLCVLLLMVMMMMMLTVDNMPEGPLRWDG